nr:hypothetical protein Iba_chr08eCG4020 [Ipomoea batatas]
MITILGFWQAVATTADLVDLSDGYDFRFLFSKERFSQSRLLPSPDSSPHAVRPQPSLLLRRSNLTLATQRLQLLVLGPHYLQRLSGLHLSLLPVYPNSSAQVQPKRESCTTEY